MAVLAALRVAGPGRTRVVALITAAMFVDAVFFAVIAPLLPDYSDRLGLSRLEVGLLFAAHPLGTLLCAPFAALLVGRRGGAAAMAPGLLLLVVSVAGFGFAAALAPLLVCRFAQGASAALVWCGGLARLQALAPPQRRGAALGLAGSAAGAGSLFGPALAALCAASSVSLVLSCLAVLTLGLWVGLRRQGGDPAGADPGRQGRSGGASAAARARPVGVILVCGTVFGAVATLAPLQLDHLGVGVVAIAAVFALSALAEMFASPLVGHLSDLVGRLRPMRIALVLAIPLLAVQALTGSPWLLAVAVACTGAAVASLWPLGTAHLADESPPGEGSPGGVFALSVVAWSGGLVVGALLAGGLAESVGAGAAYAALGAACAASLASISLPSRAPDAEAPA